MSKCSEYQNTKLISYGGITIKIYDYEQLAKKVYINDNIVNFYLRWIHANVIKEEQREKVYIFDSFFYTCLSNEAQLDELDNTLTRAQKRHSLVQMWTKNVNLFEKDFIVIPICEDAHWFLAIICFPRLAVTFNSTTKVESEHITKSTAPIKQPLVLVFDSLANGVRQLKVISILQGYVNSEFQNMTGTPSGKVQIKNIPGHLINVPQQNNCSDCGLHLLQYVAQFFTDPIRDYRVPIQQLANWFDPLVVTRKREDISKLIKKINE